jgi:D-alanyl-D-alanine carboxypeptidase
MAMRIPKSLIVCVALFYVASADALQLKSQHAIVVNSDTGAVLLEKNAQTAVPIASLTKLMTAMVVLDSKPDMNKILRMMHTRVKEPTGISPDNTSSATDLATMAAAASLYPEIVNITTQRSDLISLHSRRVIFPNTNHLVGSNGWNIRLSKTGFTNEAGKNATLVLLNAKVGAATRFDALNIRRYLGSPVVVQSRVLTAQHGAHRHQRQV